MAKKKDSSTILKNKKATHLYSIQETMECGIELKGTEVKSVKSGKISFTDSYAKIDNSELWLIGLHISPYTHGNIHNHDPDRKRKLLVHKDEIKRLRKKVDEKGLTLIPLRFYLKHGIVKLELGVCKGKKEFDRREDIKHKDLKRDAERDLRYRHL
jgi:SsrA-binding protein